MTSFSFLRSDFILVPVGDLMWTANIVDNDFTIGSKTSFQVNNKYVVSKIPVIDFEDDVEYFYAACLDWGFRVVMFGIVNLGNFHRLQTIPFERHDLFPVGLCIIGDKLILGFTKDEDAFYRLSNPMFQCYSLTTNRLISTLAWSRNWVMNAVDQKCYIYSGLYSYGYCFFCCVCINDEYKLLEYDTMLSDNPVLINSHRLPNDKRLQHIVKIAFTKEYISILCESIDNILDQVIYIYDMTDFSNYSKLDHSWDVTESSSEALYWNDLDFITNTDILVIGSNKGIGVCEIFEVPSDGSRIRDDVYYTSQFGSIVKKIHMFVGYPRDHFMIDQGPNNLCSVIERYVLIDIKAILHWLEKEEENDVFNYNGRSRQNVEDNWNSSCLSSEYCNFCDEIPCLCSDPDPE